MQISNCISVTVFVNIERFSDRAITYTYYTLHYYEENLKDSAKMKKKLVDKILGQCLS